MFIKTGIQEILFIFKADVGERNSVSYTLTLGKY
jgi:hypothetical protein